MDTQVGAFEAKTHLSALLDRVERGERLTITRSGKPVAELSPLAAGDIEARRKALARVDVHRKRLRQAGVRVTLEDSRAAIESATIRVPALWPHEVANALEIMRRRKRLDDAALTAARNMLLALAPEVESVNPGRCWDDVSKLAREHQLSVYDAAYLELAKRRRLPLATLDKAQQQAARRAHVGLV